METYSAGNKLVYAKRSATNAICSNAGSASPNIWKTVACVASLTLIAKGARESAPKDVTCVGLLFATR